ncbi:MAG: hypothetical protein NTY36_02010 [Deltaproteobacteria bacterium]|nr:hypothetical protein [Deltaproteobacteria bacterium]
MRTGKRFGQGLVIGLAMCICLTGLLANPAYSQPGYTILHRFTGGPFDGNAPYYGGPVLSGSTLYGMTNDGPQGAGPPPYHYAGALYKINTDGTGYQILHDFGDTNTDGTDPRSGLALSGSTLYGFTAHGGGPYAYATGGSVFKINTGGGGYEVLHRFSADTNNQAHPFGTPIVSGSKLYGMTNSGDLGTNGEIFALNTDGGEFQVLHEFGSVPNDGAHPYGALTLVGSRLYGMTRYGGSGGISYGGYGVIFSLNTGGGEYQVLHNFAGGPGDGSYPTGSLTLVGSKLYGMTSGGGDPGGGVLFSLNPDTNEYQVLLGFNKAGSPSAPYGSLTLSGSRLYGMTSTGGTGGSSGVIFQVNPDGTGFHILHGFFGSQGDGGSPLGDVTLSGGRLYGWTYEGGGPGVGGVFFSYQLPQSDAAMMLLLSD